MEHNQSKGQKLLTPLMLASALSMVSIPAMAYDHDKQISMSEDGAKVGTIIANYTVTGTGIPSAPYDRDTD
ncbi:MAG TPA: hypothetical protein PK283_09770 [Thiotrichales bacterium]|nr:MAG: hypothetical protein B7Y29_01360 [Thiotrichales bacterium 16-46-22]OZA18255.1 MAG: hypothetical protein B7X85_03990 [Thiotrichales bacterium 17-46-47]HQR83183.1 hypothetical protein [Thiotrichales bacterium]HQR96574.1 hypothetical protein [Thiotrichales bacterium]HQT02555.1 hypothetical protein [Thiotrichales bacterium]